MTISAFLEASNISARAFAEMVGVDPGTVSRWISGECVPDGEHIEKAIVASKGKITLGGMLAPSRRRRKKQAA